MIKSLRNALVVSPNTEGTDLTLLHFIRTLKQRYQAMMDLDSRSTGTLSMNLEALLPSLDLAEASIEKSLFKESSKDHYRHITVIGPTQAGKSTMINWLVGEAVATPSPLAGYTVHPQGFAFGPSPLSEEAIASYFKGYQRIPRSSLNAHDLNAFSLESLSSLGGSLNDIVLWDTPDFDSVDSTRYQHAVLRVAALSDLLLITLSKDKYGDLSVWEFLKLIEPLGQPTTLIINKTDPDARAILLKSLEEKWRQFRADPLPEIITFPYWSEAERSIHESDCHQLLIDSLRRLSESRPSKPKEPPALRLIKSHWTSWTAPIILEHGFETQWQERLDRIHKDAIDRYQRDYLNHPNHYETFQRALAELLTLLEIPGLGSALVAARSVVTWPVKQLSKMGRLASGIGSDSQGSEVLMLNQLAQHAMIEISESVLLARTQDPLEQRWWDNMRMRLVSQRPEILNAFETASKAYATDFQPEIDQTARGLYEHLQEHPVVLNTLRATRVTTDATALAVALHTGGIGVQDFVIAPAMLSLTSILAEGALGHYMNRAQTQLQQRQLEAVRRLFKESIIDPLKSLPLEMDPSFRIGISPETLTSIKELL